MKIIAAVNKNKNDYGKYNWNYYCSRKSFFVVFAKAFFFIEDFLVKTFADKFRFVF